MSGARPVPRRRLGRFRCAYASDLILKFFKTRVRGPTEDFLLGLGPLCYGYGHIVAHAHAITAPPADPMRIPETGPRFLNQEQCVSIWCDPAGTAGLADASTLNLSTRPTYAFAGLSVREHRRNGLFPSIPHMWVGNSADARVSGRVEAHQLGRLSACPVNVFVFARVSGSASHQSGSRITSSTTERAKDATCAMLRSLDTCPEIGDRRRVPASPARCADAAPVQFGSNRLQCRMPL